MSLYSLDGSLSELPSANNDISQLERITTLTPLWRPFGLSPSPPLTPLPGLEDVTTLDDMQERVNDMMAECLLFSPAPSLNVGVSAERPNDDGKLPTKLLRIAILTICCSVCQPVAARGQRRYSSVDVDDQAQICQEGAVAEGV